MLYETLCHQLFDRLKQADQAEIEDYDQQTFDALTTDAERLAWLQELDQVLGAAVDTKESAITDLESEVDDLRAVTKALEPVEHKLKLRLAIELVEGQLPLAATTTKATESGA